MNLHGFSLKDITKLLWGGLETYVSNPLQVVIQVRNVIFTYNSECQFVWIYMTIFGICIHPFPCYKRKPDFPIFPNSLFWKFKFFSVQTYKNQFVLIYMTIFGICTLPPPFVSKKMVLYNLWFNEQKSNSLISVDQCQQNIIVRNKLNHSFSLSKFISRYFVLVPHSNKSACTQNL